MTATARAHPTQAGAALGPARLAAPTMDLTVVSLIENGWDNRVLLADDRATGHRWVFRFPRRVDVLPDIEREARVLRLLAGRLPVAVPDWQVHRDLHGTTVIGYPALPGAPAGYEPGGVGDIQLAITVPPPPPYALSLGATLAALHAIPPAAVTSALGASAPSVDTVRALAADSIGRCRRAVPVPVTVAHRWDRWLTDDTLWQFQMVLRHGDIHPEHTLVDRDGTVTGIIDWTDAGWGDPADDFIDARHAFGPAFGDELLRRYAAAGGHSDPALARRVVMREAWGAVTAVLFGLDHDRPEITAHAARRIAAQAEPD